MTTQVQITKIGDQAAIILSDEMLVKLGVSIGEKVEVSAIENSGSENAEKRRFLIKKLTREIFDEHREALTVLAEGAK